MSLWKTVGLGVVSDIETFHFLPAPISAETLRNIDLSFRSAKRRFPMRHEVEVCFDSAE